VIIDFNDFTHFFGVLKVIGMLKERTEVSSTEEFIQLTKDRISQYFRRGEGEEISWVADTILEEHLLFSLEEDSEVIHLALALGKDATALKEYRKLQLLAREPIHLDQEPSILLGAPYVFNFEQIQKGGERLLFCADQVPRGSLELWEKAGSTLKTKLQSDEGAERLTEKYPDLTVDEVIYSFLESGELRRLLAPTEEFLKPTQVHFFSLLKRLSRESQEGDYFTAQEILLLDLALMINACPAGKERGLFLAYEVFCPSLEDQLLPKIEGEQKEIEALAMLQTWTQQFFTRVLTNEGRLMRALTGTRRIKEVPHQAKYIKNLIGPHIGLHGGVQFDPHVDVVYTKLREMQPDKALALFNRFVKPEAFLEMLQERYNNLSEEQRGVLYNQFKVLIGEGEELWDFEDLKLKREGALVLANKAQVLSPLPH
jgi:hypothetical protein